jgi:glycosyltransferase involved in cell wall biosynthesis
VKLGIVYHMPFWRAADGTLREIEGSFARYVDSLAPYFDEVILCVPVLPEPRGAGTAIRAANVSLASLPPFDGPVQFYPRVPFMLPRFFRFVRAVDVVHYRVPTPAAAFVAPFARLFRRPEFLLVVGDLEALLPSMPYLGMKRRLWSAYTRFEERTIQRLVNRALTFANGDALAAKHARGGAEVVTTRTTTIDAAAIATRRDTCGAARVRLLTVSRIDPRKGLQVLPQVVKMLVDAGIDAQIDIVGPVVGAPGEVEREAITASARALGIADRVVLLGPVPLGDLLPRYAAYDIFVLPTLPGEGIPRVLLEAMASGMPVVATRVSGIPSLITDEVNGLLVDPAADSVGVAVLRVIHDSQLRRSLIANGYRSAASHTLEAQAARTMAVVSRRLGLRVKEQPAAVA